MTPRHPTPGNRPQSNRLPTNRTQPTTQAIPDPITTTVTDSGIMRVHIPPLEKRRLYRSLLTRMPLRTAAFVVGISLVDRDAGRAAAIE
jgi:hypothetical protein